MKKNAVFLFFLLWSFGALSQTGVWYKGDLHSHSTYSDGNSSVRNILLNAESKDFTYYVLTDHDNIYTSSAGQLLHWTDTAYHSNSMILLYGTEWTTDNGHACILNTSPFAYDSIFYYNTIGDPINTARIVKSQGGLFSVNHPLNPALLWQYSLDFDFPCMEILNGPIGYLLSSNDDVITDVWEPLLMLGKRITAVGGSDMHNLNSWFPWIYPDLGSPTTWIFSNQNNQNGILNGLKNGHVCISNSPTEPHLDFFADINMDNNYDIMMGDNCTDTNSVIKFKVHLVGSSSNVLTVKVIKNGAELYSQPISISSTSQEIVFSDIPGSRAFYRIELLSDESPVAWTNPIYFGYSDPNVYVSLDNYSESNQLKLEIFPNPTTDFISISNNLKEDLFVNILNVQGIKLRSLKSGDESILVDLQEMPDGIYFVEITSNYVKETFKILKQ